MSRAGLCATLSIVASLTLAGVAAAGAPAAFWRIPEGTVASWAMDPAGLGAAPDRNRRLVESGLAWMLARAVDREDAGLLGDLIAPAVLGASPYRLMLLRFEASVPGGSVGEDRPARIDRLRAVMEVHEPEHREELFAVIRKRGGAERSLALPGGRWGVAIGTSLAWFDGADSVLVGFGEGALEGWFALGAESAAVKPHTAALPAAGEPLLRAWVDLNAVRRGAPELFAHGRLPALLRAWRLSNARSLMVDGRLRRDAGAPRLVSLAAAWSSRAEPPGTVRSATMTADAIPAGAAESVRDAGYVIVLRPLWREMYNVLVGSYAALTPDREGFEARYRKWASSHSTQLVRSLSALGEFGIVAGAADGERRGPTLVLPIRPQAAGADGDLRGLFASLSPAVGTRGGQSAWWLATPDRGAPWAGLRWSRESDPARLTARWEEPETP